MQHLLRSVTSLQFNPFALKIDSLNKFLRKPSAQLFYPLFMLCLKLPGLIRRSEVALHLSEDVRTLNTLAIFIYSAICPASSTLSTLWPGEGQKSPEHHKASPRLSASHTEPPAAVLLPALMRLRKDADKNSGSWLPWRWSGCQQHPDRWQSAHGPSAVQMCQMWPAELGAGLSSDTGRARGAVPALGVALQGSDTSLFALLSSHRVQTRCCVSSELPSISTVIE